MRTFPDAEANKGCLLPCFPILSCWNVPCLLVLVFFWDSAGLKPQPAFGVLPTPELRCGGGGSWQGLVTSLSTGIRAAPCSPGPGRGSQGMERQGKLSGAPEEASSG